MSNVLKWENDVIVTLAFQAQKSDFVTTLKEDSQGQTHITKAYKEWSIKSEYHLLIMRKKAIMETRIL